MYPSLPQASIIQRGVQSCISHCIAVLRQRTFMKKSFTEVLTKTHLNHRRTLELKNSKIRELEQDIEEDRTLQKLSRELEETKWMLQTLPGVPPRLVHLVDPTRACVACKRQVLYQEYCAAAGTELVTIREGPGLATFKGCEPKNMQRNLFTDPPSADEIPETMVGVDGVGARVEAPRLLPRPFLAREPGVQERVQAPAPVFEVEAYRARVDRDEALAFGTATGGRLRTPPSRGRISDRPGSGASGTEVTGGPLPQYVATRRYSNSEWAAFGFAEGIAAMIPEHLIPEDPPVAEGGADDERRTGIEEAPGASGTGELPRAHGGTWSPLIGGDLLGGQLVSSLTLDADPEGNSPSVTKKRQMNRAEAVLHGRNSYKNVPSIYSQDDGHDALRGCLSVYPQAAPATRAQRGSDSPFALGYSSSDDWRNQRSFLSTISGGSGGGSTLGGGSMSGGKSTRYRTTMGASRTTNATTVRSPTSNTTMYGGTAASGSGGPISGATTSLVRSGDTWALVTKGNGGAKIMRSTGAASPGRSSAAAMPLSKTLASFPSSGGGSPSASPKAPKYPGPQGGTEIAFQNTAVAFGYNGADGGRNLPGMTKLWK